MVGLRIELSLNKVFDLGSKGYESILTNFP